MNVCPSPKSIQAEIVVRMVASATEIAGVPSYLETITPLGHSNGTTPLRSQHFVVMKHGGKAYVGRNYSEGSAKPSLKEAWSLELQDPIELSQTWMTTDNNPNLNCWVVGMEAVALPLGGMDNCARVATYLTVECEETKDTRLKLVSEKWFAQGQGLVAEVSYGHDGKVVGYSVFISDTKPKAEDIRHCNVYVRTRPRGPCSLE